MLKIEPFFIERSENGSNQVLTSDIVDDLEVQRASPYAFHFINENLEFHRDLFYAENDDEDEGNLRNQMKGNYRKINLFYFKPFSLIQHTSMKYGEIKK